MNVVVFESEIRRALSMHAEFVDLLVCDVASRPLRHPSMRQSTFQASSQPRVEGVQARSRGQVATSMGSRS